MDESMNVMSSGRFERRKGTAGFTSYNHPESQAQSRQSGRRLLTYQ